MTVKLITPYEARCAAYWLHEVHGYSKTDAGLVVDRGKNRRSSACAWFCRSVDDSCAASRKASCRKWKDEHREENRARDVEFGKHQKTPYYKALKEAVGDLRVLRDRSGYDAQS